MMLMENSKWNSKISLLPSSRWIDGIEVILCIYDYKMENHRNNFQQVNETGERQANNERDDLRNYTALLLYCSIRLLL